MDPNAQFKWFCILTSDDGVSDEEIASSGEGSRAEAVSGGKAKKDNNEGLVVPVPTAQNVEGCRADTQVFTQ